jgi:hypothetical protein
VNTVMQVVSEVHYKEYVLCCEIGDVGKLYDAPPYGSHIWF